MKTAFCTFVYGSYDRYIPYYLLAINKNYQNTSVVLIYDKKLDIKYLNLINANTNVILIENIVNESKWTDDLNHKGAVKQSLRHLLKLQVFEQFDTIYFGDVDILHLREDLNLFDFHLNQAESVGLPFSNKVRPMPDDTEKSSGRLTGLHFIKVKEYFERMDPVINKFKSNQDFREKILKDTERNEHVLYNLCQEAFHFDPQILLNNQRPWHGFHLGLVRGKTYLNETTIEENSSISIENLKRQLSDLNSDGSINKLLMGVFCIEIYHTFKYFKLALPTHVKLKYECGIFNKKIIQQLKKLKTALFHG